MSAVVCLSCNGAVSIVLDGVTDPDGAERFAIAQCRDCGLGHTIPRPHDVSSYYDDAYHGSRHGRSTGLCVQRRIRRTASVVEMRPGDRLLDVGCGDGDFMHAASARGWISFGTESAPHIARARGFEVGETLAEAARFGPFRCVTLWHSLEHLDDPLGHMRAISGLLSTDGVVLVAVPDFGGHQARFFARRWVHLDVPRHLQHFTSSGLTALLGNAGLTVVRSWHCEVEYDLFGLVQSASNALFAEPNLLFRRLRGKPSRSGAFVGSVALGVGAGLSLALLPLVAVSSAMGRGGTLVVAARRREETRDERG